MLKKTFSEFMMSLNDKNYLSKIIHFATISSIAVFVPYYYFTGSSLMAIIDGTVVILLSISSIFFIKENYFLGKLFNLIITSLFLYILTFHILDYHTKTNLFFLLLIVVSLTVPDYDKKKERIMAIIFSSINIILAFASEIVTINPIFNLPIDSIKFLRVSNTITFGLLLTVIFFFYNYSIFTYQKKLSHFASTDSLTGILNRRAFLSQVRESLEDNFDHDKDGAILLIDIDHFKSINDRFGHPIGDKVLKKLTESVASEIRGNDLFGRYGGEEFIILLRNATPKQTEEAAERIRRAVESLQVEINPSEIIGITISIGICRFSKETYQYSNLEDILENADRALYTAKKQGRNQCVFV